jgi:hypothetical protein
MVDVIVRVRRIVKKKDLDWDDRTLAGGDGVSGHYLINVKRGELLKMHEKALDIFHGRIGIANLDNFEITVHLARKKDLSDVRNVPL